MESVNPYTGEITTHKIKGLWAHFPIRAYQALGNGGFYHAQRVLLCLVSHMGRDSWEVFPSYPTITALSGVHKNYIRGALDTLIAFEFIEVSRRKSLLGQHNLYRLNPQMYQEQYLNDLARSYLAKPLYCLDCHKPLLHGDVGILASGMRTHFGCGGTAITIDSKRRALARTKAIKNASADDVLVPTSSTDSGQS